MSIGIERAWRRGSRAEPSQPAILALCPQRAGRVRSGWGRHCGWATGRPGPAAISGAIGALEHIPSGQRIARRVTLPDMFRLSCWSPPRAVRDGLVSRIINSLTVSFEGHKDRVGHLAPHKRTGVRVPCRQPGPSVRLEVRDRPLPFLGSELSVPALHGVEPTKLRWK